MITYDLRAPGRNYSELWAQLNRLGAIRVLESVWSLDGNYSCQSVRDFFQKLIDSNDGLFVARFDDWAGSNIKARPS